MVHIFHKFREWLRRPNKSSIEQFIETIIIVVPIAFIVRTYFYGLYQVPTGSMEKTILIGDRFLADKFTVLFMPINRGDIISFNSPTFKYSENRILRFWEEYVWGPENWTKRVVGLPGEHVKGVIEDGKPVVYINDVKLAEPYVNPYPLLGVYKEGCNPPWEYRSYDPSVSYADQPFYRMTEYDVIRGQRILKHYGYVGKKDAQTPFVDERTGKNLDVYDVYLKDDEYWAMGDNRLGSYDCRGWGPLKARLIHGKIKFRFFSIDPSGGESWLILDIIKHPIDFWKRVRWNRCFEFVK
jgi:signal peptidase I